MRKRRGVSPAVSTVILLAVTITVSLAVGMWIKDLTTGYMRTEEISLDHVTADVSTNIITAHVRNGGKDSVYLDKAYIGDVLVDLNQELQTDAVSIVQILIPIGDLTLEGGKTYEVKIVSTEGTQLVFSVRAVS